MIIFKKPEYNSFIFFLKFSYLLFFFFTHSGLELTLHPDSTVGNQRVTVQHKLTFHI